MTERQRHLLEQAANAFVDLHDPLGGTFLADHDVTAVECLWLSRELSRIVRYHLAAPSEDRECLSF